MEGLGGVAVGDLYGRPRDGPPDTSKNPHHGPGIQKPEDVRVKIALGVRRFWDSDEGQAEKRLRRELAREVRLARQHETVAHLADGKPF